MLIYNYIFTYHKHKFNVNLYLYLFIKNVIIYWKYALQLFVFEVTYYIFL